MAGVLEATKDHTLVRKAYVTSGNQGNWSLSAGTNEENSEWIVYEQNTWNYLGLHSTNPLIGCTLTSAENYSPNASIDDGSCYTGTVEDIDGNIYKTIIIGNNQYFFLIFNFF